MTYKIRLDDKIFDISLRFDQYCSMVNTISILSNSNHNNQISTFGRKVKFVSLVAEEMKKRTSLLDNMSGTEVTREFLTDMIEELRYIAEMMEPAMDYGCVLDERENELLSTLNTSIQGAFSFLYDTIKIFDSYLTKPALKAA